MPTKSKLPQKREISNRDRFQTPAYATELLLPFIPGSVKVVWECAAGQGKIAKVLNLHGYRTLSTDLLYDPPHKHNFLLDLPPFSFDAIITNPPYSSKKQFFLKALEYDVPVAMLIPADYSSWVIDCLENRGCEKIIPTRRIDYITPNAQKLLFQTQIKEVVEKETGIRYKKYTDIPLNIVNQFKDKVCEYSSWEEIPPARLAKQSAAQFHSMWLTYKFGLTKTETFVELTKLMKEKI